MKVLIKGAGDLASGIALRLYRSGFDLVLTDIAVPTTVRRTVAFSPAVYEGVAVVEDVTGVLCHNMEEIESAVEGRRVPVVVDETGSIKDCWKPDVIVDAIVAKRNIGTTMEDAAVVIAIGPGFTAGVDCHCVVETKRGHNLGRCVWNGSAVANTGVPGMIGGYGRERIIRAGADGRFTGCVSIGDFVEQGQVVGRVEEVPVYAKVGGVVRGLLQDGVMVTEGMKSGDVDPRGVLSSCFTVSDKASAIGGGVLEAILSSTMYIRQGPH